MRYFACSFSTGKLEPTVTPMLIFNSGLDFIKLNILTKFHEDWIRTGPCRVYSWFYSDLT